MFCSRRKVGAVVTTLIGVGVGGGGVRVAPLATRLCFELRFLVCQLVVRHRFKGPTIMNNTKYSLQVESIPEKPKSRLSAVAVNSLSNIKIFTSECSVAHEHRIHPCTSRTQVYLVRCTPTFTLIFWSQVLSKISHPRKKTHPKFQFSML